MSEVQGSAGGRPFRPGLREVRMEVVSGVAVNLGAGVRACAGERASTQGVGGGHTW